MDDSIIFKPPKRLVPIYYKKHGLRVGIIILLLILGAWVVYSTGGTAYSYPYLMLVPIIVSANWYTISGGVTTALAAGIIMAFMPQDSILGSDQTTTNYLLRIALYVFLGLLTGWLSHSRHQAFEDRRRAARTDHQSGLANQTALHEDLREILSPLTTAGVIQVKITDLDDVIEALGIEASEELIVAISQRLNQTVRGGGKIYRISPDELAIVIQDIESSGLEAIVQRFLEVGEESHFIRGIHVRVQLALGSALMEQGHKNTTEILRESRIALFTSIRKRKEHVHFSSTLDQRSIETLQLIGKVKSGLANREFELHYQPKIRLEDGQVCGCEGLIRWRGEGGEIIPPNQFMPKVENTSLIGNISYFVIESASLFSKYIENGNIISINLSSHNIYDEKLHELLSSLIKNSNIKPGQLEIEITESAFIDDIKVARYAIQRIRDLDIKVSIDDFGTGFSSFSYLHNLPVTGLKIDRSFISRIGHSEKGRKLVGCMIDIGHSLELEVTAEGVETQHQEEILRQLGCDQAQGFYYSPALPAREYLKWLNKSIH